MEKEEVRPNPNTRGEEMKPIKTQIEELEREVIKKKEMYNRAVNLKRKSRFRFFQEIKKLKAKLQTLKECQKMFDDFVEKLKDRRNNPNFNSDMSTNEIIDKLSKEVLGE